MFINIVLGILLLWIIILTFFLYQTKRHYHKLISKTNKKNIEEILDKLVSDDQSFNLEIKNLKKEIIKIEEISHSYFQRLGIIRFNPFERIGGDQSFVLALLNKEKTGVVINFLYTREGMRVYAKRVESGKGVEYDLSDEEKEAIKKCSLSI